MLFIAYMAKCNTCNTKVEQIFLGKIMGTYIREGKKLKTVCSDCQRKDNSTK